VYSLFFKPLNHISGIGPALEKRLHMRGIEKMGDLLLHLPRAYEDDRQLCSIAELKADEVSRIEGVVVQHSSRGYGGKKQISIMVADDTGELTLNFFHSAYMLKDARLAEGRRISVRGTPQYWGHQCQMTHPDWCVSEQFTASIQPVYSSVAGLSSKRLQGFIAAALKSMPTHISSPLDNTTDMPLCLALRYLHQPADLDFSRLRCAMDRLKSEEILIYGYLMEQQRRLAVCKAPALRKKTISEQLIASLPFALTAGQAQAWQAIQTDLASGQRMHRLVQGDVGSGKTWVAALAAVTAIEHGLQAALMAPTEVLAVQHFKTLSELLEPLNISVALLTGSTSVTARRKLLTALVAGDIQLIIGTHALISDDVIYARLGLAIVDEQHRFGVKQRWALTEKQNQSHEAVHLLGMTATPIPRSLAMAVYGDMDLSVMKGMPIGRKPVETRLVAATKLSSLAAGMQRLLEQDGRIYWIVPRIDEDEEDTIGVSVAERVELLKKHFPHAQVLGLHGKMKAKEKQLSLEQFSHGDCKLLVSTTVVEVGVNVPEARLIVIDAAEQYGLAQLHQLRGRVGRSNEQGYCMLLPSDGLSDRAKERLSYLVDCHDGLELAEKDLALRGSGDAMGTRQSGEAGFRLLDLANDAALLRKCYEVPANVEINEAMIRFWRPLADSID